MLLLKVRFHIPFALFPLVTYQYVVCLRRCAMGYAENFVSLRYTATGAHVGTPHNGIPATGRRAQWTAAGNFVLDNDGTGPPKIRHWLKDWDKMQSTSFLFLFYWGRGEADLGWTR